MKKIIAIFGLIMSMPAIAEEVVVTDIEVRTQVTERMTCSDISDQIKELSAIEEPDAVTVEKLDALKVQYRRDCTKSLAGRRTSGRRTVSPVTVTEETEVQEAEVLPEIVAQPEEQAEPVLTTEQEVANLEAGLCADGSKPNRFGCCAGEKFMDLGNLNFACCPEGDATADCFPPIK